MNPTKNLFVPVLLLVAACATPVKPPPSRWAHHPELREFQHQQDVFRTEYSGTHDFDFEGHGRVTVREVSLDGFPGNAYVRCRFQYQNRTAVPMVQAWVSLDVLDAKGQLVNTQATHMVLPTLTAIDRGAYYCDELRTPTYDAHLEPGWKWRIRLHADPVQAETPLSPPVPEYRGRQASTFLVKDYGWPYAPERR